MRLYDNEAYREEFMALVYALLHDAGTNDLANQIIDAFDTAPEVEAEPLLPNDPLTMAELREMDGEPVWVDDDDGYNGWARVELARVRVTCLLKPHYLFVVYPNGDRDYAGLLLECGIKIYRRKPEERTT